jgi:predicted dithiol-disulfide oxidoreductase (DUF899 family)
MHVPNESEDYRRARNQLLAEEIELRRHIEGVAELRRKLPSGGEVTTTHQFVGEMGLGTADPGQDPRGAPDLDPLWTILDTTPEGRGADWYPKLNY